VEVSGQLHAPGVVVNKIPFPAGNRTPVVQPVASHYID